MFGSSGNGTSPHLSGELFNLMAGVKLVHVPYKGSPQAVTDLLAGRVQVMFSPVSTVLQHVKAGTLRGLASTGLERASAAPELPTIAESGLPGLRNLGLVRAARAGGDAARDHRAPEPRDRARAGGAGHQVPVRRAGHRHHERDPGAVRRLHPPGNRQVGARGAGIGGQA